MNPKYLVSSIDTYISTTKELKSFDSLSLSQLEEFEFNSLKKIISYAWDNVDFYRITWSEKGFHPDKFKSISDYELIPIIDRNSIIDNLEAFIPKHYDRDRLAMVTTGGTSGMPMKFYIDNYIARGKEMAFLNYINKRYFGIHFNDPTVILRGYRVENDNKYWKYSHIHRGLIMSSFHLTKDNYPKYINKLRSYKPKYIKAYPSSIVALCLLMRSNNEQPLSDLKGIICSSENVYNWQRELVENVLGVKIFSYYGHSEKCVSAFQDHNGNMLFHPLYGYTEFIDKNDNIIFEPGSNAEVVVTGFNHNYFPLIRYRTNDIVEIGEPEGNFRKIAKRIIGREQDFVYDLHGNRILFTNNDEPFWEISGIIAYQYIQKQKGHLLLNLQVDRNFNTQDLKFLYDEVKKIFIDFKLNIEIVPHIEKTSRGKFKYLIQNCKI